MLHAQRLVANDRKIALAGFGIERLGVKRQCFEIAAHAGQGRHQLVRHVGQQQTPRATAVSAAPRAAADRAS